MIAYSFRRLSSKALIIAACFCLLLITARENPDAYRDRKMVYEGEAIAKLDTTKIDVPKEEIIGN